MSADAASRPGFEFSAPDLSVWRAGNSGVEGVWHFDSGRPGRQVMLSALVHGNELCGAWALIGLLEAGLRAARGALTLAFCNLAAFDHFDAAQPDASRFVDQDLNRQWLDARINAADSQERRRAAALRPFVARADWLLDLHSMHEPCAPLLLAGVQPRNLQLARAMRSPAHVVIDSGHQDGVRMRDYGRFGLSDAQSGETRSLLIECGFHGDLSSLAVARDQCLRFIELSGVIDADALESQLPGWRLADAPRQSLLEVTQAVVAASSAFRFAAPYQGLESIAEAGSVIGDDDGRAVRTPYDDCVLVMPSTRQARAGVTVVRFARQRPI